MKTGIAYYRLSKLDRPRTGRNGEVVNSIGLGLDAQRAAVHAFAALHGIELTEEFSEIETGKGHNALDRRPVLASALAAAKKLKAPVIVAKLDRLSRDVAFISSLMVQGVP